MIRFINLLFMILLVCGLIIGHTAQSQQPTQKAREKQEPNEEPLSPMKYGRDNPFTPVTEEFPRVIEKGRAELEGIMWDEKQPLALIGGAIVKVGDKTSQGTVTKIEKDKVILQDGIRQYEIRLGER